MRQFFVSKSDSIGPHSDCIPQPFSSIDDAYSAGMTNFSGDFSVWEYLDNGAVVNVCVDEAKAKYASTPVFPPEIEYLGEQVHQLTLRTKGGDMALRLQTQLPVKSVLRQGVAYYPSFTINSTDDDLDPKYRAEAVKSFFAHLKPFLPLGDDYDVQPSFSAIDSGVCDGSHHEFVREICPECGYGFCLGCASPTYDTGYILYMACPACGREVES